MEIYYFQSFPLLIFTSLFISVIVIKLLQKYSKAELLPPGPMKLPLIGNLHNLANSVPPHESFRDLAKKFGPIMHLNLGEVSTIVVSSAEMAKEVMITHDSIFAYRPSLFFFSVSSYGNSDIAFAPYGSYWRQMRKICVTELLSVSRVKSFRPIREEEVNKLIKSISSSAGSPINLTKELFSLTHSILSKTAFGEKCKDEEAFIAVSTKNTEAAGGFCLADLYPSIKVLHLISGSKVKSEKMHAEIDRILGNIVEEHRKRMRMAEDKAAKEDLVDVLLRLQQNGNGHEFPITDRSIKAVVLDMFAAGGDPSATTINWAMAEMMKNPRVMKQAQDEVRQVYGKKGYVDEENIHELKFLKSVIKETLRLHPPAPLLLPRENSTERCVINGYDIPFKTRVMVNAWAIGRDPSQWSDAETFYPERFLDSSIDFKGKDFQYIPFGAGRRMCLGISFALSVMELPLAQLLYHFDWKLVDGQKHQDLDMSETSGLTTRRKQDLILISVPYLPSGLAN